MKQNGGPVGLALVGGFLIGVGKGSILTLALGMLGAILLYGAGYLRRDLEDA